MRRRILLVGLGLLPAGSFPSPGAAQEASKPPPPLEGRSLDGERFNLKDWLGKLPVAICFTGHFHAPSHQWARDLRRFEESGRGRGLKVLLVSLDEKRADAARLAALAGPHVLVLHDPGGKGSAAYRIQALPHTVVVDRKGNVSAVVTGAQKMVLERALEQALTDAKGSSAAG